MKRNKFFLLIFASYGLCIQAQGQIDIPEDRMSPVTVSADDEEEKDLSADDGNIDYPTGERTSADFQRTYESTAPVGKKIDEKDIRELTDKLNYSEKEPPKKKEKEKKEKNENKPQDQNSKSGSSFWLSQVGKTAAYTIAIIALIFIVVFLIFRMSKGYSNADTTIASVNSVDATDAKNLAMLPLDELLSQSMEGGDFKLAVRLLYLKSLKQLMEKGLLKPSPEKTNFDYVRELSGTQYYNDFRGTTAIFEQVWYGEYQINKGIFNTVKNKFADLHDKLRLGR